jgi:hypothetical protein
LGIQSERLGQPPLRRNVNAAHQVLGNSLEVAMKAYIKPSIEDGLAGLKLLEAATTKFVVLPQ